MKYLLMMNTQGGGDYAIFQWPAAALQAHAEFMRRLNQSLEKSRELVAVHALTPPSQGAIVRVGPDGAPVVTDGPFAETKEFLAGFWIVEVKSPERAWEIAATASTAPGPDGAPLNMPIEVRLVPELRRSER